MAQQPDPSKGKSLVAAIPAVRQVTLTGFTRARHVMDVKSEEPGRCEKVTADVGDIIGKDGIFAKLDMTYIVLAVKKNQTDQKRLKNLIAFRRKEVRRHQQLLARRSVAQATLDELQNQLDQAQFELDTLRVEESTLKEKQQRHIVKIPSGWKVIDRFIEPGEWVPAGKTIARAGDFRSLLVPFSLSPDELHALRHLRGNISLRFPKQGKEGLLIKGSVERISPAFDPQTRKIEIDLLVDGGLPEMRGGLRAEMTLSVPDPSGDVLLPRSAIEQRYEEYWVTRSDGEKIRVSKLGKGPGDTIRVRSQKIRPGDTFRAKWNEER